MCAERTRIAVSGASSRITRAASRPSTVWLGGIRISMIASSGRCSRTSARRSEAFPLWPTTSNPARSSSPASPSRSRTSSSAITTRVGVVFKVRIMGYLDAMGTSARPAGSGVTDRAEPGQLAEEQAALRRVATLVARGAPSTEVFGAVAQEIAQVLDLLNAAVVRFDDEGATVTVLAVHGDLPDGFQPGSRWPLDGQSMSAQVLRTGRPARVDDYTVLEGSLAAEANRTGFRKVVGAPIIVDDRVWGLISTSSPDERLPDDLEDRLAQFTELVATAIANTQARDALTRIAEEQAALRRVATLVAEGAAPGKVFEAVSTEIAHLLPAEGAALTRFADDGTVTALGGWTATGGYIHAGTRYAHEGTV